MIGQTPNPIYAGPISASALPPAPRRAPVPRQPRHAIVIGGGLAGIAAAVRLAEQNISVTLLERARRLGGRATSFQDAAADRLIDNCQHVAMGCCVAYLDLLSRLGTARLLRWSRRQTWLEADPPRGRAVARIIRPGRLPAPFHAAPSLLRSGLISSSHWPALARAGWFLLTQQRPANAGRTFADLLAELDQPPELIRRLWEPVVVSACNATPSRVAADVAMHVFQDGFLAGARAGAIAVPAGALVELYETVPALLARAGGRVLLGESAQAVTADSVLTARGDRLQADRIIIALPWDKAARLVQGSGLDDGTLARVAGLEPSPILGVHLMFDARVLPYEHAVLVDRPTQWLFRKDAQGRTIHAVISAADAWMDLEQDQIVSRVIEDIRLCLPETSRHARLLHARAVKERRATFAPTPASNLLRPGPDGPGGLLLAGDYTATGWPATMESAVRSGYAAAARALHRPAQALLPPELPTPFLVRFLAEAGLD